MRPPRLAPTPHAADINYLNMSLTDTFFALNHTIIHDKVSVEFLTRRI